MVKLGQPLNSIPSFVILLAPNAFPKRNLKGELFLVEDLNDLLQMHNQFFL
jgi:hypothetical protein